MTSEIVCSSSFVLFPALSVAVTTTFTSSELFLSASTVISFDISVSSCDFVGLYIEVIKIF